MSATATIVPTAADLDALERDAIDAWHNIDFAMMIGDYRAVLACEAEWRACALAHHEAKKARDARLLEAEHAQG